MNEHEILQVWGKTARETGTRKPLLFHMLDTANVALAIWETVLQRSDHAFYAEAFGFSDDPLKAKYLVAFWAGLHDVGKAFPQFQDQIRVSNPLKHGHVTAAVIPCILQEAFGYPREIARQLAMVLGGHHGVFPRSADLQGIAQSTLGGSCWAAKRLSLVKHLHELLEKPLPPSIDDCFAQPVAISLAGFVSVADWIASNQELFQFDDEGLDAQEYAWRSQERAAEALNSLHWSGWTPPKAVRGMEELFDVVLKNGVNDLQRTVTELACTLEAPGLVIIEAPMGEGKTEAAMYLADNWAAILGQRGCYFALPTQATSNQMFGRVREFLGMRYRDEAVNLMLLHGHAALSAEFKALKENAACFEGFSEVGSDEGDIDAAYPRNVLAAEWFTHRKRGLLAPFGVGTIDQILLSVLQTRHVFVRLFGLTNKTIIVDEVHAYDAYMVTLLERLLEWLASLRCSVVLLSATLPKKRTAALMSAYAKGAALGSADWNDLLKKHAYPRVTWLCGGGQGAQTVQTSPRSAKDLRIEWVNGCLPESERERFALGEKLRGALSEGGCAAVICSTVDRAQRFYQALKACFPETDAGEANPELDLFHARYLFKDREAREKRALLKYGKPDGTVDCGEEGIKAVKRPRRAVLVATQVIEQSLDLDFDLMVTDMAPVDLILQRAGRLHRHSRDDRPEKLREPMLWICAPEREENGVPVFDGGTKAVYDRDWGHVLLRSWLSLKNRHRIDIPGDVEELIDSVYNRTSLPEDIHPELGQRWEETRERLRRKQESYTSMAQVYSILPPFCEDDILEDFNRDLEEDNPESHHTRQALTRPSELPSVNCVCLYQHDERMTLDPEGCLPIDLNAMLSLPLAAELLRNSLRISHRTLAPLLIEHGDTPSLWRRSPLLRHHRLLCFDRSQICRFQEYELHLDSETGLRVSRLREETV